MKRYAWAVFCGLLVSCDTENGANAGEEDATGTPADTSGDDAVSRSYSGPGSFWSMSFDEAAQTFHAEVAENAGEPIAMEVNGTFEDVSGWKVLTVTEASDVEGAPSPGDQVQGIEVPGFAFLLQPPETSYGNIIPMLIQGECPEGDESLNWMIVQGFGSKDASTTENDFFGTYRYQLADNTAEVTARYALAGYTQQTEPTHTIYAEPCAGSVMSLETDYTIEADLPPINLWMVPGGAMVETYYRDWQSGALEKQTMLGLNAAAFSQSDLTGRTFIGMRFGAPSEVGAADGVVDAVEIVFDADGVGTAQIISDVRTGETSGSGGAVRIDAINTPSAGFFTATVSGGEGVAGNLACSVAAGMGADAQTMMSCVGQTPGNLAEPFTLMLVSLPE